MTVIIGDILGKLLFYHVENFAFFTILFAHQKEKETQS